MNLIYNTLGIISEEAAFILLGVVILIISRLAKDFLTPYKINDELVNKDNPALGLSITGYYMGVVAVYIGTIVEINNNLPGIEPTVSDLPITPPDLTSLLLVSFAYSMAGILLLNLGRIAVDKLVLYKFNTTKEIIDDQNIGTGAVEFGNYLATGFIVGAAASGEGGGLLTMIVFFILGQLVLVIYSTIYQMVIGYDMHDEIERDNIAAGIALGGNMLAAGIILLKGISGHFTSWADNLETFAFYTLIGIPTLLVFRLIIDIFLLPGVSIDDEIAKDKNLNAGFIESGLLIGIAAIIFFTT